MTQVSVIGAGVIGLACATAMAKTMNRAKYTVPQYKATSPWTG